MKREGCTKNNSGIGLDCLVRWQLVMFIFTKWIGVIVVHPIAMLIPPVLVVEAPALSLKTMIHFWCKYLL